MTISRDVFGKHPEDLTLRERRQCFSFIALAELEAEEREQAMQQNR